MERQFTWLGIVLPALCAFLLALCACCGPVPPPSPPCEDESATRCVPAEKWRDYCATRKTCEQCASSSNCAWCGSNSTCGFYSVNFDANNTAFENRCPGLSTEEAMCQQETRMTPEGTEQGR